MRHRVYYEDTCFLIETNGPLFDKTSILYPNVDLKGASAASYSVTIQNNITFPKFIFISRDRL